MIYRNQQPEPHAGPDGPGRLIHKMELTIPNACSCGGTVMIREDAYGVEFQTCLSCGHSSHETSNMSADPRNALPIGTLDGLESFGWPELDDGIRHFVCVLRSQGIETFESCQGGKGHCYAEPTIAFHGDQAEGPRAVAVALTYGLPVVGLRRTWEVRSGEMIGPQWEVTFQMKADDWIKHATDRSRSVQTSFHDHA
ncbi:MAG TPA: hypothetical protein VGV37_06500 [Aliidongia sp.]|uniref:hypothetical protein n=1 Tax=Aliidongia sp. TaxID=1914230 RepID=UPI002DDDA533|nr:hypothetical protein [Aliidongia sp.]HEV2674176.1 hypothetical protein [Aliidongia sp.]